MKTTLAVLLLHLSTSLSFLASTPKISNTVSLSMKLNRGFWPSRRPSVLGLVGGIASGKSTVSRVLGECCGVAIIDADKLGHESYQPGTRCFDKLVEEFGTEIVARDGTIDRRALGAAVFGKPGSMLKLQGIVWPEIRLLAEQRIDLLGKQGKESVVLEAAVLLEAGWDDLCDELWVVQVPPAVARARLMQRDGFGAEQADKRMASQPMTNEERAARATLVVANEGTEEELTNEVKRLWASRSGVLWRRKRRRSLTFLSVAAIAGAAVIAAASVMFRRGRALR